MPRLRRGWIQRRQPHMNASVRASAEVPKNPNGQASAEVPRNPNGQASAEVPRNSYGHASAEVPRNPNGQASAEVPKNPNGQASAEVPREILATIQTNRANSKPQAACAAMLAQEMSNCERHRDEHRDASELWGAGARAENICPQPPPSRPAQSHCSERCRQLRMPRISSFKTLEHKTRDAILPR
jgi:hypothetical protein